MRENKLLTQTYNTMTRTNAVIWSAVGGAVLAGILANYFSTEKGKEFLETATDKLKGFAGKATDFAKESAGKAVKQEIVH
jgi:hypothetical protein